MNQRLSEDTRLEAKDTKNPRPRAKDQLLENRHSRGQGQEGSRPRPKDTRLKCSPKKGLQKVFFRRSLKKRSLQILREVPEVFQQNFTNSKNSAVLNQGQGNFRGLEASRPRSRT